MNIDKNKVKVRAFNNMDSKLRKGAVMAPPKATKPRVKKDPTPTEK